MIVLFDIGNTRTKYCTMHEGVISKQKAILNQDLSYEFLVSTFDNAEKVLVVSVSHNHISDEVKAWCQINHIAYQRVVSETEKNNVTSAYEEPSRLGVDRWLALLGAAKLFPNKNILIIDAGTATTVDLLAANGQHQGGWILAGINTLVASVLAGTSQVDIKCNEKESLAFGVNTTENVHNAAWSATTGMVNLAIDQAHEQGVVLDIIIFTGGNGMLLASLVPHKSTTIEALVFTGLQAYI